MALTSLLSLFHFFIKGQSDIAELALDVTDNLRLGSGNAGAILVVENIALS